MRVLIVHPSMSLYGGAELVIVKLANYLTRMGISNAILTINMSQEIREEIHGSDIILPRKTLTFLPRLRLPFVARLPLFALILLRHVRKNLQKFDIINVHNFPAEFAAFSCPKKVVWMCNEPPKYILSPIHRWLSYSIKLSQ